jgi:hypothetical protein
MGRSGMKIETKYDVGHTFWVARVYKRYEINKLVLNGQVYATENVYFEPVAKKKIIAGIHSNTYIDSDGKTVFKILYNVIDYDRRRDSTYMTSQFKADNYEKMFPSEEAAMDYARKYKDSYTGELYSVPPDEEWEV